MSKEKIIKEISSQIMESKKYKMVSNKTPGVYAAFYDDKGKIHEIKKGLEVIGGVKELHENTIFNLGSMSKQVIHIFELNSRSSTLLVPQENRRNPQAKSL